MAARLSSSMSRSLMSTATRTSSFTLRPPSLHRPPPLASPFLRPRRRLSFTPSRTFGELGCTQSFLPLNVTTPRLSAQLKTEVRAFSELYHGIFCRTCQDR